MKKKYLVYATYCCIMTVSHQLYAQYKLTDYPQLEILEKLQGDTSILFYSGLDGFEVIQPKSSNNNSWYCIDTNFRDAISVSKNQYLIDSLLYSNYLEYAGRYYFGSAYEVVKQKFYIVNFFNEYQQGTMIQPCFMVLTTNETQIERLSLYMITDIEDNSGRIEESLTVFEQDGQLRLSGINLELVKDFLVSP